MCEKYHLPLWIQKEIDRYNNLSVKDKAITKICWASLIITLLSHIKIIIVQ